MSSHEQQIPYVPAERPSAVDLLEQREPVLNRQLNTYLNARERVQERHSKREARERRFLQSMYAQFIIERNERADDFNSVEVQEARKITDELMPVTTYGISCMDSRVMRTIMYGLPLGHGGFLRIPAGDLSEITPAEGGGLTLIPNSDFEKNLKGAAKKSDIFAEVLDSHVSCAAQQLEEEDGWGDTPADGGLYEDVLNKKQMALAIRKHVGEKYEEIFVMPIQTSFNPEDGFLYMGLEKDDVLAELKESGKVYTPEVRDRLVQEGKIIHTKEFLQDTEIMKHFTNHTIDNFDWELNYKHTISAFWANMKEMKRNGLMTHIENKVREVLPDGDEREVQERATLLALNAYNAYHLNKEGEYPHGTHKESVVVASEGENGPYAKTSSFSVYSKAKQAYDPTVRLAANIVRQNRKAERIKDTTGQYSQKEEFNKAPVPVAHKVIIRREDIDWSLFNLIVEHRNFVPENWHSMSSDQFLEHLEDNVVTNMPTDVFKALDTLRQEMARVYEPEGRLDTRIFKGQIEIVPVVVDSNRKIRAIVPFVYEGYPQNNKN